jgi:hypothetical protein
LQDHKNVFIKLADHSAKRKKLPEKLWAAWKRGRNLVFHYFPHNFRKLSYEEAREIIDNFIEVMHRACESCEVGGVNSIAEDN